MNGRETAVLLKDNINRVFVGKEEVTTELLICLLSGGHLLIEDVPGVGKTTLALALARSMNADFGRLQCTPDTLPGDISGLSVYNMKTGDFDFQPGVVMNHIVLADEINRTSPKTQAGLLEAMEEHQVTVDNKVHELPEPFFVIATQNPVEFLGTYPLPEAQLDRFMMRIRIGYPSREEELRMASVFLSGESTASLSAVASTEDVLEMQKEVRQVKISEELLGYISDIIFATRNEPLLTLGASPRALLSLIAASQGAAYLAGRDYVLPDDIKFCTEPVLSHRVVLSPEARIQKTEARELIKRLVMKIRVPAL